VSLDIDFVKATCKPGSEACCRFLACGPGGLLCLKFTTLAATVNERVALGTMVAKGDNCQSIKGDDL
jgi:hypothetical protein